MTTRAAARLTFDGAEHLGVATISEHLCTDIAFARGEVGAAAAVAHAREIVGRGRCVCCGHATRADSASTAR